MKSKPRTHPYAGDGIADHRGRDRCAECRMPKGHANHELPPAPPAQAEHRRRIGDTNDAPHQP